ncbi:MAG: phosphatase PAP2 family protein [Desulfurococcales archaeon]|nr:phosphatase PAP2 family protein [Desulfurococcales archaeon]
MANPSETRLTTVFLTRKILCAIPFILIYIYYEYSRAVIVHFDKTVTYRFLISFEEKLFHQPLTIIFLSHRNIIADYTSIVIYALHPVYLVLYALVLLFFPRDSREYTRFTLEFTLASAIGVTVFYLVPVAPPWIAIPGVTRLPNPLVMAVSAILHRQYYDPNPYAALPSLHVGLTVIFVASIYRLTRSRKSLYIGGVFSGLMAFSVLYTGNHYLIDIIAGYLVGLFTVWGVGQIYRKYGEWLNRVSEKCGGSIGRVSFKLWKPKSNVTTAL